MCIRSTIDIGLPYSATKTVIIQLRCSKS